MTADALAPCVARSSAAMTLVVWIRQVLVLREEGCQPPMSCQCGGMIEIVNTYLYYCLKI